MSKRDTRRLENRQMDTLVGISRGITADGVVNQQEAEFILEWLDQTPTLEGPLVDSLFERLSDFLDDGFLDADESAAVLDMLNEFVGGSSDDNAFVKTWMPVDETQPPVAFRGQAIHVHGRVCARREKMA